VQLLRTNDGDEKLPSRTPTERKLCKIICKRPVKKSEAMSSCAFALMSRLLEKNQEDRPSAEEAMTDPFFDDFQWGKLEDTTYSPSFVPREGANVSTDMVVAEAFDKAKKYKVPGGM
jgi:serine/threonine protein kinase